MIDRITEEVKALGKSLNEKALKSLKENEESLVKAIESYDMSIKVDEEGTEAAAVSFAGMYTAAAPGQHIVFHADKPFLYLITESSTGVVLFAGKFTGKH